MYLLLYLHLRRLVLPLNKRIRHGVSQNKVDRNVIVNLKLYEAGE